MSRFRTNLLADDPLNVSSVNYGDSTRGTTDIIYIGSDYDESIVTFKAFVSSISYDMSKQIEEKHNPVQDFNYFASYSGEFKIKLTISVPAANVLEAKNNYAKITHLQGTVLSPSYGNEFYRNQKNWHWIYFSNLINKGASFDLTTDSGFEAFTYGALPSVITSISYKPDTSQGFLKDSNGGLYPKAYELSLEIIPDSEKLRNLPSDYVDNGYINSDFLSSFIDNGQYDSTDSPFFPFLVPVGKKYIESIHFDKFIGTTNLLDLDTHNMEVMARARDSYVYIALPTEKNTRNFVQNSRPSLTGNDVQIRRELVFDAFIEDFSRNFSNSLNMETKDMDRAISQTHASAGKLTKPPEWSISFNVPSKDLRESKYNCAKMQTLMRMFYRRRQSNKAPKDQRLLDSVVVHVPSFIGHLNDVATTPDHSHMFGYTLQITKLSIEIETSLGFFKENAFYYPKAFKVSIDLKDSITQNYRKFDLDGTYGNKTFKQNLIDNNPDRDREFITNLNYWNPIEP
jgi:hypothetical protein